MTRVATATAPTTPVSGGLREYSEAIMEHLYVPDMSKPHTTKPTDDSGYGYSTKLSPYADCPKCDDHFDYAAKSVFSERGITGKNDGFTGDE